MPETLPPITQVDRDDAARNIAGTKAAARNIASMIAEGLGVKGEGTRDDTTATGAESTKAEPKLEAVPTGEGRLEETGVAAGTDTAGTEAVEGEEPVAEVDIAEIERVLNESGIDLGISSKDVPEELLPAFEHMVQSVADFRQSVSEEQLQAQELTKQIQDFAKELKEHPDRLLLTMAVNNPDVFSKAVEVFNEMQQNERLKEVVIKELESEARLREADRREGLLRDYEKGMKARRVIAATQRASRTMNVPFSLAEKVVASVVAANGGDLDPAEVNDIVKDLAGELETSGRKPVKKPVRVATTAKVTAAGKAPTGEVAGATPPTTSKSDAGASAGLSTASPHAKIKGLIQGTLARLRQGNQ